VREAFTEDATRARTIGTRSFKEMSGAPTARSDGRQRRITGSPTGREPYGDGVPIVVVGIHRKVEIPPHPGGRESRPQGEGGQVTRIPQAARYARCGRPQLS
jgi:hypothetical protein